jgi:hypothetical protein
MAGLGTAEPVVDTETGRVLVPVADGPGILPQVAERLAASGLRVSDLALRRPTLDDVFLALTDQHAAHSGSPSGSHAGSQAADAGRTP